MRRHAASNAVSGRPGLATRRALIGRSYAAFAWVAIFIGFHVYWMVFGGQLGFGDSDASRRIPDATTAPARLFAAIVLLMFVAGALLPLALVRPWGHRVPAWLLLAGAWAGCLVLASRGAAGLVDMALRASGLRTNGLTGLTYEQIMGDADPSAYTLWSSAAIDLYFVLGGVLFGLAARAYRRARRAAGPGPTRRAP